MKVKAIVAAMVFAVASVASAASPTQFKDSGGNSFDVTNLRSIECVSSTQYKITHTAESGGLTYSDTSGVCAKVVSSAYGQANLVQVAGTNRYLNVQQIRRAYMDGSNTKVIWNAGPEEYFTGNSVHTSLLAASN